MDDIEAPALVFDNRTAFPALHFKTVDQFDTVFNVFVLRQTYRMEAAGQGHMPVLKLAQRQLPLATEDRCHDGREQAGVAYESDLAPYKPRCDVVVNAVACAPRQEAVAQFDIALSVEAESSAITAQAETLIDKRLEVIGERRFVRAGALGKTLRTTVTLGSAGLLKPAGWKLTQPEPFATMPVRYDQALGGECRIAADNPAAARIPKSVHPPSDAGSPFAAHDAAESNPLGRGFTRDWNLNAAQADSVAAPRIVYKGQDFNVAAFVACMRGGSCPAPAGLGFVGRGWLPRRRLTGKIVVKKSWSKDEVPRLPEDFDFGYWNGAPRDQQCRHLLGGEVVTLTNLCGPDHPCAHSDNAGNTVLRFRLPVQTVFMLVASDAELGVMRLAIDTVVVDPDAGRVDLVWRGVFETDSRVREARLMQVSEAGQMKRVQELLDAQERAAAEPLLAALHTE